jgi:hypothetical protein
MVWLCDKKSHNQLSRNMQYTRHCSSPQEEGNITEKQQMSHHYALNLAMSPFRARYHDHTGLLTVGRNAARASVAIHLTLKMESVWLSETMESYHITTQRHNPENQDVNLYLHENLKSRIR